MTEEEIQAMLDKKLADALAARDAADVIARQREQAEQARIDAAVESALKSDRETRAAGRRLPDGGVEGDPYMGGQAPHQAKFADTRKYDHLGPVELSIVVDLLGAAKRVGHSRGGASPAAVKAAAIKLAEDKDGEGGEYARSALKALNIDPRELLDAAKSATKANELMHSTQTGFGDEWVGQGYSTALWEAVRAETFVIESLMSRGQAIEAKPGEETFTIPLEGADMTWYNVAATTAIDATTGRPNATIASSKAATGKVVHSLAKAGARTIWNGELEEDSLIPAAPQLRRQIQTSGAEQLEHAVIDGDTDLTASTNINHIAGTPGGTELYTLFNGIRKSSLITTTANARSAGGSLLDTDFLETVYLMGTAGLVGSDRRKVDFIIDPNVHKKAVQLASVKTRDVFRDATIENGIC